jgi:hypothetical protein
MSIKSILSVAEAYAKMATEDSQNNLAATDAAMAQKKQEPMGEIPSWVPGSIPDEKKKEFAEAANKAWESDNTQFDFDGRTYKITEAATKNEIQAMKHSAFKASEVAHAAKTPETHETAMYAHKKVMGHLIKNALKNHDREYEAHRKEYKKHADFLHKHHTKGVNEELVGNQKKLDVNKNGKIDADDLAKLRGEKEMDEHHLENEVETPGQTQYPGTYMKDVNKNGIIDGEDKAEIEGVENPTDKLTFDVPAMIRALEKAREDFKSDEDVHNFVQDLLKKKDNTIDTNTVAAVKEAVDYHAAALSASEHAKKQPSAATHKAAADAHDKAIAWHEKKVNALMKKDGSAEEVKTHEQHIKMHQNEAQKHRFNAHRLAKSQKNESVVVEKLDPKADAGVWIDDFVNSTDPKFAGKSKEERKQQALAAYYQARRDAGLKEDTTMTNTTTINENIAADPHAAGLSTKANQATALAHATPDEAGAAAHHKTAADAHHNAAQHYRVYMNHAADPVLKRAAGIHHQFHSDMADHHMLRGVDFSMKEQVVAEGGPADAKAGPEVMDPKTKKMKDDHNKQVKTEEAPYTNKADGSENIVPADKPAAKPSPMPKLTKEETLRSVADAYAEMLKVGQK